MSLKEIKGPRRHFWLDEHGHRQGEYKDWWHNGQPWEHSYWKDNKLHGECKLWNADGCLSAHSLYSNGEELDFDMSELPSNSEELLLFRIKYGNLPLLNESEISNQSN